ncbi:MAG: hypothetical protein M3Q61_04635 [Chloroflexota bacterium]|nr:hypothetical protein [Chloroflexota bacterium]
MKVATIVWKAAKMLECPLIDGERASSTGTWTAGREMVSASVEGAVLVVQWRTGLRSGYPLEDVRRLDLVTEAPAKPADAPAKPVVKGAA